MSKSASRKRSGFDHFGLHESLLRGIDAMGFTSPRPIQTETIPAGLSGQDVLGLAQTGTGKTAAFALPLLHRLMQQRRRGPRALVIAPTRELATQIADEIRELARFTKMRGVTIFGGVPMSRQISGLRCQPEIVVGCPGRILDLLDQEILHLDMVETLVLDEADHMFDMGFLPDIRRILEALPKRRQNLLFSATMPREVRRLADDLLTNPTVVDLAGTGPAHTIDHALVMVAEQRKRDLLTHLLSGEDCDSAIVFTRTKHRAKRLADQLNKAGHSAVGLQGNLSQPARDRAMRGFRSRRYDVLVATDIAARGIDVNDVSHVINYDVPNTPEAYTHRIGRTGRSEREGIACTFVTRTDHGWVRATERMIGSPIQRREVEGFEAGPGDTPDFGSGHRRKPQGQRARSHRPGGNGGNGGGGHRPGGNRPGGNRPGGKRPGGDGPGASASSNGRRNENQGRRRRRRG